MVKKFTVLPTALFVLLFAFSAHAETSSFLDKTVSINWLHFAKSTGLFTADAEAQGVLRITNTTPNKSYWGYVVLNGRTYWLNNNDTFVQPVSLKRFNAFFVSLLGAPGTTLRIEILPPEPAITSFTVTPESVAQGSTAILAWATENADTVAIEPGIGPVVPDGSVSVTPDATTTYTLTAANAYGSVRETATVTVFVPPAITIVEPNGLNDIVDESFTIQWEDEDPDSDATISLYYDTDNTGADGILITLGLSEDPDGVDDQFTWDTSTIMEGDYYIYAVIDDGVTPAVTAYSPGPVTVFHNNPPVFAPVADQQVIEEQQLTFTVQANDIDNDPLNYSATNLPDNALFDTVTRTFSWTPAIGQTGSYAPEFTVTDGDATDTITVQITVVPHPPVVEMSASSLTINIGESPTLTWTSYYADTCTIEPDMGDVPVNGSVAVTPQQNTTYTIIATGPGGTATDSVSISFNRPTVTLKASPTTVNPGQSSTLTWTSTNAVTCTIDPEIGSVSANGSITVTPDQITTYIVTATGPGGTITRSVTVSITPPAVTLTASPTTILYGSQSTLTWTSSYAETCTVEPDIGDVPINGSVAVSPEETTSYTITATGPGGVATRSTTLTVKRPPQVSLNISPTVITYGESTTLTWDAWPAQKAYLNNGIGEVSASGVMTLTPEYTTTYALTAVNGDQTTHHTIAVRVLDHPPEPQPEGTFGEQYNDLIPEDASLESYDAQRFIVITGLVVDMDNNPLPDVTVGVLDHPEYGSALTDETGRYSIPAEGGTLVKLSFEKPNYLSAHRKVEAPVMDVVVFDTVALTTRDPAYTLVAFDGNPDTIVTHKSTEIIDPEFGNRSCTMVFTGDTKAYELDAYGNRIQELPVITTRATEYTTPESMPAILPPTSAFTYCAELEVDGVKRVEFDKPVVSYVDNFLGFDVGEIVPVGYYDRDRAVWVPSDNGVVVRLLDTNSDGMVDALDTDGDNLPDDLDESGFFNDDVVGLNTGSYQPGNTYWRFQVNHFSPWDCNWAVLPSDSISPNPDEPPVIDEQKEEPKPCATESGSYVNDRSRIMHEDIPIMGTGITLHYASERTNGYKTFINVPASGDTIPASLKYIIVTCRIAGQTMETLLSSLPNQKTEFVWDGLDYQGGKVKTPIWAHISIGFAYDNLYASAPSNNQQAFAQPGEYPTTVRSREDLVLWKYSTIRVIPGMAKTSGNIASGWSISTHHHFNPSDLSTLHKGDGSKIQNNMSLIATVAGSGTAGYSGDGGPATEAKIFADGIAIDAEGNLFFAERYNMRVRKVDTSGIITTVAGNGGAGFSGDGGPATKAKLWAPLDVTIDSQGNLFIADTSNRRVRKVDTSGIITTVAGNGETGGYSGEGGLATEATLSTPWCLSVDTQGNLVIFDFNIRGRILMVDSSGYIFTIAGNGAWGYSGDGGSAFGASFARIYGLTLTPDGDIIIADTGNHCIRKISSELHYLNMLQSGGLSFADSNGLAYFIDDTRHHKETIDIDTGKPLYTFTYGAFGGNKCLATITDQFGNQTLIHRYPDGTPYSIESPDGLITQLSVDGNSHLTRIILPDNGAYDFTYTEGGLLTDKIEPNGNYYQYAYDENGRVTDTYDSNGGHWNFDRYADATGIVYNSVTTGENNTTIYEDKTLSTGQYISTIFGPSGGETTYNRSADGLTVQKDLSCGMSLNFTYDVDPEYKYRLVKSMTETTPSGLARITEKGISYQDTNADEVPDLITRSMTVNGKTTTVQKDVIQSTVTATSPEGRAIISTYDPDTLVTLSTGIAGLYQTAYGYYADGRLESVMTGTRETSFTYDSYGYLASITDPKSLTTYFTNDLAGRVTHIARPDGTNLGFEYDANGNMTVLTNLSNVDHLFGYNGVDLNAFYTTPLSGSYSYSYDKDRRLVQKDFPSGKSIYWDYTNPSDVADKSRLWRVITPEGDIDYTYLCGSKVESVSTDTEAIAYGYDGKLVTSETLYGTINKTLSYTYNEDFNVESFTYAGATEDYFYDNDGLLTGAGGFTISRYNDPGVNETGLPYNVTDGALNLGRTFNSYGETGKESSTVAGCDVYEWNVTDRYADGRIKTKTETIGGVTTTFGYTYDEMGRLETVVKDGSLVESYSYDSTPYGTCTYQMNSLRGIAGRVLDYDAEDRLLSAGGTDYQYDLDGFLTSKASGAETTYYDYSSRGELLSVDLPDGTDITYVHDPLGRRIAKKVNGTITEKYLWSGLTTLLAVYDGSDNLLMRFKYADSRMPVAVEKEGITYYLAYDQVGSLRAVADSLGNIVEQVDYDSFGFVINDTNPGFDVSFGFAGGLYDKDTGLVRFGYRDYDPDTGRWTAKDLILFDGGDTDLFGYCLKDPINFLDPYGLISNGTMAIAGKTLAAIGGVGLVASVASANLPGAIVSGVAIAAGLSITAYYDALAAQEQLQEGVDEANEAACETQSRTQKIEDAIGEEASETIPWGQERQFMEEHGL